jgi:hypothetical protein
MRRIALVSIVSPVGMADMKSAIIRAVGTSMTCPARMPAMLIGAGFTTGSAGASSFSVQDFLIFTPAANRGR